MTRSAHQPSFDQALYSAALAYYGLPADYCRVFTTLHLIDPATSQPRFTQQGDPVTVLMACSARAVSTQGKAVWVQVNRPLDDAARTGKGNPKKAKNSEIASLANVTLDFEYPREPVIAHRIGLALADFLVVQGLALPGLPVEDSGAGCHIVLPLPPIELSPETAERWNTAVAHVVKNWILPEFLRLCAQEQVTMDLCGYDISRVLSVPGTWRPTNPKKPDCTALQQGYLRRWLPPYTGDSYPMRRESARLAELIREAYASPPPPRTPAPAAARLAHEDPRVWLEAYAAAHSCTDRSACFQRLVSAVYLKFGEETVQALRDDIHTLSGEKYNGRLEVELARSLARAKAHPRIPDNATAPRQQETKHEDCSTVLSGDPAIDQAILAREKAALYQRAPQIAELPELALSRVRLALKEVWGPGFPLREFDDVLKAERRLARSLASRQVEVKSARALMATPFAPVEWVVPGVLPVGLIALAGKQKIGKSWLDDNLALAVAAGGKALGTLPCKQGEVLYLALEDNDRRMQERIKAVLPREKRSPKAFPTQPPGHGWTRMVWRRWKTGLWHIPVRVLSSLIRG